jgi:chemotaxis protein MotB
MMDEWQDAPRDRWLLSYADLVTLLLAFFVVMYSVSAVNESKLTSLAETLSTSFQAEDVTQSETASPQTVAEQFIDDGIDFELDGNGDALLLSLPGELLFASGQSELSDTGLRQLKTLLPLFEQVSGKIQIEGHTDNLPIQSDKFPSNWELSAHRAAATVRFLESAGVSKGQLSAVGLSDSQPVAINDTNKGRNLNRRVVVRLEQVDWQALESLGKSSPGAELSEDPEGFSLEDVDPALLEEVLRELEAEGGD